MGRRPGLVSLGPELQAKSGRAGGSVGGGSLAWSLSEIPGESPSMGGDNWTTRWGMG